MVSIFILTKPPGSPRSRLCLLLMERSEGARLYLLGDGVYNLLSVDLPTGEIYACREDMEARGVEKRGGVRVIDGFYEQMVKDIMEGERAYAF
jgi:tRNA 2-thiouridine synthesizing protein B